MASDDPYRRYVLIEGWIYSNWDDDWPVNTRRDATEFCSFGTCETQDGVTLSVESSNAREGTDATLDFTVTVDNPRAETMTVGWRTHDSVDQAKPARTTRRQAVP